MSTFSFYPIRVKRLNRETSLAVSIELEIPEEYVGAFEFKAGQYVTFRRRIDGEDLRRAYSICAAPYEKKWIVAVKEIEGGRFSKFANRHLVEGDILEVAPPDGRFVYEPDLAKPNHYIGYAGGSGITPIMAILKSVLHSEEESTFTLLYGNRSEADVIFKEEIEFLVQRYAGRLKVYHIFSEQQGEEAHLTGFIDSEKIRYFQKNVVDLVAADRHFICGPEPMLFSIQEGLDEIGVLKEKIIFELFIASEGTDASAKQDSASILSRVQLIVDDECYAFELDSRGSSILDGGIEAGADLPFACKGGVCATCKARVEKGEVVMDKNYSLEQDEIEAGFILTCQAHPISEEVLINYDVI